MKLNSYITLAAITLTSISYAQKKETIGTEEVNVVKAYAPTISDAFKIKEVPPVEVEQEADKEKVSYKIFSYPVASTYSPTKGKPDDLAKEKAEKLFGNYLTLGFGNYGTPLLDYYTAHQLNKEMYIAGSLQHLSSQGGIKNVPLDNSFYNTKAEVVLGENKKTLGWSTGVGYQHQIFNWYGVPNNQEVFAFSPITLEGINPQQTYQNFYVGGKLYSKIKSFRQAEVKYNRFWDAFGSAENRVNLLPSFEFKAENQKIKADFVVDYLGGGFQQGYLNTMKSNYGYTILGFQPSIVFRKNYFSFNIGAGVYMALNHEDSKAKNKLLVYPQITASYKLDPERLTVYAAAEGGLSQNSYQQMVAQNPFVSPTLVVAPTDKVYDLSLGVRGKLMPNFSYNLKGFYQFEKGRYLFVNQLFQDGDLTTRRAYEFGNSFGVIYDNLKTTGGFLELKLTLEKTLSATLNTTYASYETTYSATAWNLPQLTSSLHLEYYINNKWTAATTLFYVGKRKDMGIVESNPLTHSSVSIKEFVDANLQLSYQYNTRLTGFMRANNIANQAYQKWLNYPVQQFQIMVGASYKFDF